MDSPTVTIADIVGKAGASWVVWVAILTLLTDRFPPLAT